MLSPISKLLDTHSLNIAESWLRNLFLNDSMTVSKPMQSINVAKHCIVLLIIMFKKYEINLFNKSNDADMLSCFHKKLKPIVIQLSISFL